jgi:uncharacterized protein (DUF427 family)
MIEDTQTATAPALRIEANPHRVRAMFAGHVVADTTQALTVHEAGKAPAHFFPPQDVETGYLGKTDKRVTDPLKGEGCCYTWVMEGEIVEQAVCAFEEPLPGAEALRGYLCFVDGQFEVYELTESDMAAAPRATQPHGSTP